MTIELELCLSNSVGSRYYEPRVVETWTVATEAEAEAACAEKRPNGYYVRRADADGVDWGSCLQQD